MKVVIILINNTRLQIDIQIIIITNEYTKIQNETNKFA